MSDDEVLADAYERLLTTHELLVIEYLDAMGRLKRLRRATRMLIGAACRTAGEYRIPLKQAGPGVGVQPLLTDVPTLLGTATSRAMLALEEPGQ